MADNNNIEYDFKEWFNYSHSKEFQNKTSLLKKVLLTRKSQGDIEFTEKIIDNETCFCIAEKFNPVLLCLKIEFCEEFYNYLCNLFPEVEVEIPEVNVIRENNSEKNVIVSDTSSKSNIFRIISSKKPFIHSLRFSFLSLIVLQALILPGNISDYKLPSWSYIIFLSVFALTFYLCIWSYSKIFTNVVSYNDIFKFSIIFCNSFFLLVFVEVMIIDSIVIDNFSFLFGFILIILGQLVGVIFSLFFAVITYFIKGGKMINVN